MGKLKIDHTDTKMMSAVYASYEQAMRMGRHYRTKRREFVKQYAGPHYVQPSEQMSAVPVNLMRMTADVYTRHVVANNPAVFVTVREEELYSDALDLELDTNETIKDLELKNVLSEGAFDAMFSQGMAIVGDKLTGDEVMVDGKWTNTTKVSVEIVDLDDWFQDLSVKRYKDRMFCGHQFRRPRQAAMDDKSYDETARKELMPIKKIGYGKEGNDPIESIGSGNETVTSDEIYEEVELLYIYFPKSNRVLILPAEMGKSGKGLASYQWKGPKNGPYHRLAIKDVPGNSMPLSPLTMIADIHFTQNNLHRKATDQAYRAKRIAIVQGNAAADGKRVADAEDGSIVLSNRPEATKEVQIGGIDQGNLAYMGYLKSVFSWLGGNIDAIGGLAPQAETLGQDRLLAAAASKLISAMQDRVTEWTKSIVTAIAWFNMHNPIRVVQVKKRIPNTSLEMSFTVRPADFAKNGDRFSFDIVPFSMTDQSPAARLQSLMQFFQFFIAPNAAAMAQQGIEVDFEKTLRLIARYSPMPELEYLLKFGGERPTEQIGGQAESGRAPITERTNIRRSVSDNSFDPVANPAATGQSGSGSESKLSLIG